MDPIADLLVQIRNAGQAGKDSVTLPHSNIKMSILEVLKKEGYVLGATQKGKEGGVQKIEVGISYLPEEKGKRRTPRIKGAERISKLSKRLYYGVGDIKPVRFGKGLLVLSTPQGIMSGKEAQKANVGGEALFKIW